jgi:hypothetical protein
MITELLARCFSLSEQAENFSQEHLKLARLNRSSKHARIGVDLGCIDIKPISLEGFSRSPGLEEQKCVLIVCTAGTTRTKGILAQFEIVRGSRLKVLLVPHDVLPEP